MYINQPASNNPIKSIISFENIFLAYDALGVPILELGLDECGDKKVVWADSDELFTDSQCPIIILG